MNIHIVDKKRVKMAEMAESNFRIKKISIYNAPSNVIDNVIKFPLPILRQLAGEIEEMNKKVAAAKFPRQHQSTSCDCEFSRKYLLPCWHVFHYHIFMQPIFTDAIWQSFIDQFEESGIAVYEKAVRAEIPAIELTQNERELIMAKNQANEVLEIIRNNFFSYLDNGELQCATKYMDKLLEFGGVLEGRSVDTDVLPVANFEFEDKSKINLLVHMIITCQVEQRNLHNPHSQICLSHSRNKMATTSPTPKRLQSRSGHRKNESQLKSPLIRPGKKLSGITSLPTSNNKKILPIYPQLPYQEIFQFRHQELRFRQVMVLSQPQCNLKFQYMAETSHG